ncbi:TraV family lipoprotein [endosymbiont of Riftia pachyptila]|uniref:Conjugative transfer protein TraV n=1 Tax=endosymbiont of Riftia pachyptila (vent Ph05) TaxID=1048808 RepID=G2DBS8_9GAMM|nr:TraV family lipoprotein [endosymbiont of Riftia pachyptila]EGV51941.1 conjugative transfer protein TraV [endosymbiont of Riftia pachyptila (vent Ph05)]
MSKALLTPLVLALLAGCASSPKYACGVPEGVGCKPVGEVYEASITGTLTRGRVTPDDEDEDGEFETAERPLAEPGNTPVVATVQPGDPLLTRPRHIRVWINRWEDKAGDLHDETYLYLRLDNGTWRLGR